MCNCPICDKPMSEELYVCSDACLDSLEQCEGDEACLMAELEESANQGAGAPLGAIEGYHY